MYSETLVYVMYSETPCTYHISETDHEIICVLLQGSIKNRAKQYENKQGRNIIEAIL
jgi:hypothetical protein